MKAEIFDHDQQAEKDTTSYHILIQYSIYWSQIQQIIWERIIHQDALVITMTSVIVQQLGLWRP